MEENEVIDNEDVIDDVSYNDETELTVDDFKREEARRIKAEKTLVELKKSITDILEVPTSYEESGVKKFVKEDTKDFLEKYLELLEKNKDELYNIENVEAITKPFIHDLNLKFPQLFQPIRIALTGGTQAPSVYDIIAILGFNEVSARLKEALKRNFQNTWLFNNNLA